MVDALNRGSQPILVNYRIVVAFGQRPFVIFYGVFSAYYSKTCVETEASLCVQEKFEWISGPNYL